MNLTQKRNTKCMIHFNHLEFGSKAFQLPPIKV
uniref:Uncharacterized protein n=1 Tax=Rhizophora mucronata TaxID=61149 RepID=A0A2P2QCS9_RHIMU